MAGLARNYMAPLIVVLIWLTIETGLLKEASGWTAIGIRYARSRGWSGWTAEYQAHRAIVMARLGRLKTATMCRRRAEELADEANAWIPALLAWADGLIAKANGDERAAKRHLSRSARLFNKMGSKHHRHLVEADMKTD